MTEQFKLIRLKLENLLGEKEYLLYSLRQVEPVLLTKDWLRLSPDPYESLPPFRVRLSELPVLQGKAMGSIDTKELRYVGRIGLAISLLRRLKGFGSADHWKLKRGRLDAAKHKYEASDTRLDEFIEQMASEAFKLIGCVTRLRARCAGNRGII